MMDHNTCFDAVLAKADYPQIIPNLSLFLQFGCILQGSALVQCMLKVRKFLAWGRNVINSILFYSVDYEVIVRYNNVSSV